MRANVKVIGIGERVSGTSEKNGKGYDFTPICIAFKDDKFTGHRAERVNVRTTEIPVGITVGSEYDCVMHFAFGSIFIDAFLI